METLSVVLGSGGVVLLLVGLVGGGFSFSGSVIPKVGKVARVPCFVTGAALLLLSVGLVSVGAAADDLVPTPSATSDPQPPAPDPDPAPAPLEPDPEPQPDPEPEPDPEPVVVDTVLGVLVTDVPVLSEPVLDATILLWAFEGETFELSCVVFGDVVTSPGGFTSDLWHPVAGGFVPDALVDTGDVFAHDMPLC